MITERNRLYFFLFLLCLGGVAWLYRGISSSPGGGPVEACLIKHTIKVPCPSCGSTRSVIALTKGNFIEALKINPLGYLVAAIVFLTPLWIIIDFTTNRKTLFLFYRKAETFLKRPRYAIPLVILMLMNWVWNISKGL